MAAHIAARRAEPGDDLLQAVLDVLLRRLPTLELAVAAEDLRQVEGLAVGGLRDVPVRW
jgi:cytochrome P450